MKKMSFPDFVLFSLAQWEMTDEQLCASYIRKYYYKFLFPSLNDIAVIGKRYESARKQLSEMRRKWEVIEVSRIRRPYNDSEEITFKLK